MTNNYKVYMHSFPNGKKYIGSTSTSLQQRWNNGKGYYFQSDMFDAICKFGWNNIKHYLLFDGLSKEEAKNIENALIYNLKTYKKSFGYNKRVDSSFANYEIPKYKKRKIECKKVDDCLSDYINTPIGKGGSGCNAREVLIIETGEVFESISYAAKVFMITPASIDRALRCGTPCCDYHWQYKK